MEGFWVPPKLMFRQELQLFQQFQSVVKLPSSGSFHLSQSRSTRDAHELENFSQGAFQWQSNTGFKIQQVSTIQQEGCGFSVPFRMGQTRMISKCCIQNYRKFPVWWWVMLDVVYFRYSVFKKHSRNYRHLGRICGVQDSQVLQIRCLDEVMGSGFGGKPTSTREL